MRDFAIAFLLIAGLGATVWKPWIGAILWVVVSVLNPHLLGYKIATLPVAAAVAGVTVMSALLRRASFSIPLKAPIVWLVIFTVWMCITYVASSSMEMNYEMWIKVMKINFMFFVVYGLLNSRKHLDYMVWAIAGSLCYYGVKGGIFTILTAGAHRVWGPEGTFIGGNNEIALALIMTIPLLWYLRQTVSNRWLKMAIVGSMVLCAIAALGSHSRGALLAIAAMIVFFWARSPNKGRMTVALLVIAPVLLGLMSQGWEERMISIKDYEQDQSSMGRINAWWMAFNLAKSNIFGASFESARAELFAMYAPDPNLIQGPHSVYFQVLGQHGFLGLFFYLAMWFSTWSAANRIRALTKDMPEHSDTNLMASMIQVSLAGFAVGGAFLGLAYFDVPYYLMAIVARLQFLEVKRSRSSSSIALHSASGG